MYRDNTQNVISNLFYLFVFKYHNQNVISCLKIFIIEVRTNFTFKNNLN